MSALTCKTVTDLFTLRKLRKKPTNFANNYANTKMEPKYETLRLKTTEIKTPVSSKELSVFDQSQQGWLRPVSVPTILIAPLTEGSPGFRSIFLSQWDRSRTSTAQVFSPFFPTLRFRGEYTRCRLHAMDRKTPHQDNDLTKTPAPKTSKSIQKFKQEYYPVLSGFIPSTFRHHTQYIPLYFNDLTVFNYNVRDRISLRKRGFSRKWKSKIAENFFPRKNKIDKHTFFFKQSVGVVESMEITLWTNASLPAKSSVDGIIVRGHLHISSYFRDGSIRPILIGQKSLLNQWTSTLHSKLSGS